MCFASMADAASKAPAAKVATPPDLQLSYEVYAGGFNALHADFQSKHTKDGYSIDLQSKTEGMIGTLFPWQGFYKTEGRDGKNAALLPQEHTARSIWRKTETASTLAYDRKGTLVSIKKSEGGKLTDEPEVKSDMASGAVDLLTGTLLLIDDAPSKPPCDRKFPVFDGKRRYNITLSGGEMDEIKKSGYSVYSGPALKCVLMVEPVAGFRDKDQKRGWMAVQNHTLAHKKPPTIWFARVSPGGPVLPVRLEINSDYGAAVAHLTAAAHDAPKPAAKPKTAPQKKTAK